jgi:hypothetical protein
MEKITTLKPGNEPESNFGINIRIKDGTSPQIA